MCFSFGPRLSWVFVFLSVILQSNSGLLCSSLTWKTIKLFLFDDAFAFFDNKHLVDADAFDLFDNAARPPDFYKVYLRSLLKPEVQSQIIVRYITRAASHFVNLGQVLAYNFHTRPYPVAVTLVADGLNEHGIVRVSAVVSQ